MNRTENPFDAIMSKEVERGEDMDSITDRPWTWSAERQKEIESSIRTHE